MINEKFSSYANIFVYVLIIVLFGGIAQHFARKYHETNEIKNLIISGISFNCGLIVLYTAYVKNYEQLWLLNNLWSLLSIVFLYFIGFIFWNQTMSMLEVIATVIIMVGIVVIYS